MIRYLRFLVRYKMSTLAVAVSVVLFLSSPCRAQLPIMGASDDLAKLEDCLRIYASRSATEGDSTVLYYDQSYKLTPVACASVRRHSHVTATGDFAGETRDYAIADNQLLFRLHYAQGVRHGLYESFYASGKPAVRGSFTRGEPTGTWEFWYANGQPRQTLEWTGQLSPRLRILAYWDSTGQQGVREGNGLWQDVMPGLRRHYGGPVVAGLPQGIWESRALDTGKLLTTEVYEKGVFKSGRALDAPTGGRYKTNSLLEPKLDDRTAEAEQVRRGFTCAYLLAAAERRANPGLPSNAVPPRPLTDPQTYLSTVLQIFNYVNRDNSWASIVDGAPYIIEAKVDETGMLNLVSGHGGIVTALTAVLRDRRRWRPATLNGRPATSDIQFVLVKYGVNFTMSYRTKTIRPGK